MRVLAHHDPVVLERELLQRVETVHPEGALGRTLVLVPTRRLAEHVQRRLVERRPAWLGLEVLHFRGLAFDVLAHRGGGGVRLLSNRLLEALLRRQLADQPENPWSRFAARRPGAVAGLLSAVRDLREAGLTPEELARCCDEGKRQDGLARLFSGYAGDLQSLEDRAVVDDAGLIRAALPHVASWADGLGHVLLHGVYELIGIHLEILRALDGVTDTTVFLPAGPSAPATSYARSFAERNLLAPDAAIETLEDDDAERAGTLAALHDEASRPSPSSAPRIEFHHAQGAAGEVKLAVRRALASIGRGCPPAEIAIVARDLGPYVPAFEKELDARGLAWTTSASAPLRRHPFVHDALLLLGALANDYPRGATAELLRSPRIRWSELTGEDAPPFGERADRWSREAGILGGLVEWTEGLVEWAGRDRTRGGATPTEAQRRTVEANRQVCDRIERALRGLNDRFAPESERSWSEHAETTRRCLDTLFFDPETDASRSAVEALRGVLDEMRDLELTVGERRAVSFRAMAEWLEQAVDGVRLPIRAVDEGGIRVLDAMQLRGLTFRHTILVGMNAGQFPRPAREDPILTEELRGRLGERVGRPIPLRARRHLEERLLLALVVGSASVTLDVSWQRADESGRARSPSLALRELARLARGVPDLQLAETEARHFPSHPTHQLEALAVDPGLIAPDEERLLTVLRAPGPREAIDDFFPDLSPGLQMLRATEAFGEQPGAFDGRIGGAASPPELHSASALEQLSRCPLQYFFNRVLRVRELERAATAFEMEPRHVGLQVHDVMHRLYTALHEEGLLEPGDPERARVRMAELLPEAWDAAFGAHGARLDRRVPLLWSRTRDAWLEALRLFADEDLARFADGDCEPVEFEQAREEEVDLEQDVQIRLIGRLDRILRDADGPIVGDYKTGRVRKKTDVTEMLRGAALQVPLYALLAGDGARVDLLGLGPMHLQEPDTARERFDGFAEDKYRRGFLETLRTLLALLDRGDYPLRANDHCDWCPYSLACRRKHPPTLHREDHAADSRDFRLLSKKTKTRAPLLEDLREAGS